MVAGSVVETKMRRGSWFSAPGVKSRLVPVADGAELCAIAAAEKGKSRRHQPAWLRVPASEGEGNWAVEGQEAQRRGGSARVLVGQVDFAAPPPPLSSAAARRVARRGAVAQADRRRGGLTGGSAAR